MLCVRDNWKSVNFIALKCYQDELKQTKVFVCDCLFKMRFNLIEGGFRGLKHLMLNDFVGEMNFIETLSRSKGFNKFPRQFHMVSAC